VLIGLNFVNDLFFLYIFNFLVILVSFLVDESKVVYALVCSQVPCPLYLLLCIFFVAASVSIFGMLHLVIGLMLTLPFIVVFGVVFFVYVD